MGLLAAQKDIRAEDIFFMEEELADFKGGMTENYVNTQLVRAGLIRISGGMTKAPKKWTL